MDIPVLRSQDEWVHGAVPAQLKDPQDALKWADHLVMYTRSGWATYRPF